MEKFIETPNILHNYDHALVVNCTKPNEDSASFLVELEKALKNIGHSFLVVLVESKNANRLSRTIGKKIGLDPRIDYEVVISPYTGGFSETLYPCLNLLQEFNCDQFIIINADGSDLPEAIPKLLNSIQDKDVVFVDKGPKADNFFFWLFYRIHQLFFRLLTGREIEVDHYSLINRHALETLLERPFMDYTTALHLRKLKRAKVRHVHPTRGFERECRQLLRNSTRALLEFGEDLLIIFFRFSLSMGFLLFAGLIYLAVLKIFMQASMPTWLPITLIGVFNAMLLSIGFFSLGAILLNRHRQNAGRIHMQSFQHTGYTPRILDN